MKSVAYNDEEQVVIDNYEKGLKAYFKEARAQFVSGVMDPNNDADWNNYLAELDTMGLADYIATAESGYHRFNETYGK